MKKNKQSLGEMWDTFKCTNICVMGVSEGEEEERGAEKIFKEIMPENLLNIFFFFLSLLG